MMMNAKYQYTIEEMETFEAMVEERYGKIEYVLSGGELNNMHVDLLIIPPSERADHYTIITMGMAAYPMKTPKQLSALNRAELAMRLPKDWELNLEDEKWNWPFMELLNLARFPKRNKTWLGFNHTVDNQAPFSKDTKFSAVILDVFDDNCPFFQLPNGEIRPIYNVLPIYQSEECYAVKHGSEKLLSKMSAETFFGPLDIHRKAVA